MYQKRWLHIDPSDNVIDAPLMYQHGWKRDVDYVIGFSRGEEVHYLSLSINLSLLYDNFSSISSKQMTFKM